VRVTGLTLSDFRNYSRLELPLTSGLTVVVGANGQGKTNLLEALMMVSRFRSPRTEQAKDVIRWGAETAAAHVDLASGRLAADGAREPSGTQDGPRVQAPGHEAGPATRIDIAIGARGLEVKVNQQTPRPRAAAIGTLLAVLFTPDDLRLVKDEPERRRAFLDGVLALTRPAAASLSADYARVLRQRNALLRQLRDGVAGKGQLEAWDEQLVAHGTGLATARAEVAQAVGRAAERHHGALSGGEELVVTYRSEVLAEGADRETVRARFARLLAERRADELARGTTLVGPHRDDLVMDVQGHPAREFASQGQQRSVALALKLAELDAVAAAREEQPVLLLDDVMSELDRRRRAALAETVSSLEQAIITTTTPEYFGGALQATAARWLRLEGGGIHEAQAPA
jgi:DNA replication and repair protein RecF